MANYTILLIDYEPRSIESLSRPLQSAGYSIVTASDGIEGIEVFKRIRPDLVLIEAMIPKKHGFEVCQALRGTEHGEDVPIAILTGVYKGRKYRHQAIHNYKCNEYLEKPVADQALVATVRRMLEGRDPVRGDGPADDIPHAADAPRRAAGPNDVPPELAQTTEAEIMERLDAILPGLGEGESGELRVVPSEDPAHASADEFDEARIDAAFAALEGGDATAEEREQAEGSETTAEQRSEDPDPDSIESLPLATSAATSPEQQEEEQPDADEATEREDEEHSAQVFSFDPDRARRRRPETAAPRPTSGAGGAAAQPLVVEPDESEREEPRPVAEVSPADATAPADASQTLDRAEGREPAARKKTPAATRPAIPEKNDKNRKMPAWVWIAAALVLVGGSAAGFLMLRGEPENVPAASHSLPVAPVEDVSGVADPMVEAEQEPVEATPPAIIDLSARKPVREPVREPEPEPEPATPPERVAASRPVKPAPEPTPPAREPSATRPEPVVETKPEPEAEPALPAPVVAAEPEPQTFAPAIEAKPAASEPEPVAKIEPAASPIDESPVVEPEASVEPEPEPVEAEPTPPPKPVVRRGQLVDLAEVDVAPSVVHRVMPRYTLRAQKFRQEGTVELNVLVDESGAVSEVVVITEIPRSDLNDSAVKAVKAWTYSPATKDGVPVKVWKLERIEFKR